MLPVTDIVPGNFAIYGDVSYPQGTVLSMKVVYERLARSMLPEFARTGSQCREKIKKLRNEYKKIKDTNGKTGRGRKSMKFYEQLNEILGTRPATRPAVLLDSGGVTEPTAGQDALSGEQETEAADAAKTASDPDPHEEMGNASAVAEPPKQTTSSVNKQTLSGKKRGAREEQFEKAMDTAIKKLAAVNEESDRKYIELEEKRLKLEEQQTREQHQFQQMVC